MLIAIGILLATAGALADASVDELRARYQAADAAFQRSQRESVSLDSLSVVMQQLGEDLEAAGLDSLATQTWGELGELQHRSGNLESSRRIHRRGVQSARRLGNKTEEAMQLEAIAVTFGLEGRLEEALAGFTDVLKVYRETNDLRMQAICWGNLSYTYQLLGRIPESVAALEHRFPLAQELDDEFILSSTLSTSSQLKRLTGRLQDALVDADSAIEVARRPEWGLPLGSALLARAEALYDLERFEEALPALEEAIRIRLKTNYLVYLPQVRLARVQVLLELQRENDALRELDDLEPELAENVDPSLGFMAATLRAQALIVGDQWQQAEAVLRQSIERIEAKRLQLSARESQIGISVRGGEAYASLARCQLRRQAVEEAWASVERGQGWAFSVRSQPASTLDTLTDVQRQLADANAALVQYSDTHLGPMIGFLVTADSLVARSLDRTTRVVPDVDAALDFLGAGTADEMAGQVLRRLGATLLDPLLAHVPAGIERLFVVLPGALADVPFEVLHVQTKGADAVELLERVAVSYLPHAGHLVRPMSLRPDATGLVAFADPASLPAQNEPADIPSQIRSLSDTPLPHARREAQTIATSQTKLYVGDQATVAAFRSADVGGAAVLHFATHSVMNRYVPRRSALLLADAMITAGEIDSLQLRADLVTLSGCRTGTALVRRGEGAAGLPAAFLTAGAASVVSSRWPVEDKAAARFMILFYEALKRGVARDVGLREAGLAMKAAGAPYRDRAAFRLLGSGHRPVAALVGSDGSGPVRGAWAAGVAIVAVLLVVWVVLRRR